ncbi:vacuolar protein sorting-associated protein 33B-like [Oppia nitens]|uniref:vacuolar protein sorting-associated protein 33B-like n=1 Tax=Oppia nitens TaxID=1686743 RepID=UPI0023DAAD86|nr:vacuolar protein sorting-associated protein 33B-like [Oppia nitens]
MDFNSDTIASILKTTSNEIFVNLLNKIGGDKDLVLSPQLISTFDQIFGFTLLKKNGVQKIFKLDSMAKSFSSKKICFVIQPIISETRLVATAITADRQRGDEDTKYWVIFVPQKNFMCDECLESEGIYEFITIMDFPLGLIPLDVDLFSLELPQLYYNTFLVGDLSGVNHICKSLSQLQTLIGRIPRAYTKGKYADIVADYLLQQSANKTEESLSIGNSLFTDLILVDRDEDYVSLLLSQLTYMGVMDEMFGIKNGKVEFGPEVTKSDDKNNAKHNLSVDLIFDDIKDMPFSSVFVSLKEKGQKLKQVYNKSHTMDIKDMKDFVTNQLKGLQNQHKSLVLHISASETIMENKKEVCFAEQLTVERNLIEGIDTKASLEFIEEGIIRQFSDTLSLRLICLYSITQSGISTKDYQNLVKLYVDSYGHKHISVFFNLTKLGIIVENSSPTFNIQQVANPRIASNMRSLLLRPNDSSVRKFRQTIKKLNLIPQIDGQAYDVRNPKDCAYVFGGAYIPLITRIVQLVCDSKNSNEEINRLLNGKFVNLNQRIDATNYAKLMPIKVILLFIIGGITYAEVAAVRFLAKQLGIQIIIATTCITNGSQFLKQLMPSIK